MARKKKVAAGEGKGPVAMADALNAKPETEKKERKSWRNADRDPEQALLLIDWQDQVKQAYAAGDGETVALLQLHHAVPSSYPDNSVGKPLGWDQLKKLGRNIMSRMVESLTSRLMKPASVQIATVDGDHKQDIAARAANKAVKGILSDNDSLQKETRMVKDCLLTHRGTGYAAWLPDADENMVLRRLDPRETWVSADGKEASTKMYWPRREALAVLPKLVEDKKAREDVVEAIELADEDHPEPIEGVDQEGEITLEDTIAIHMAWQDQRGDKPAWWVIQIDAKTAISREFPLPIHPVWWIQGTAGYREGTAKPAGREIAPSSYWVNQLQQTLWKQLSASKVKILHEEGQEITTPNDVDFQKIKHSKGKNPPQIFVPDTVSDAVERNIDKIITDALADIGLNEETTVGDIPSGVTSGIGIVKAQTELSIRFSEFSHNINSGRLRSVRILCYWLTHFKKKGIKVRGENTEDLEAIDWPGLDMKENTWSVVVQTAGALPDRIEGKHQVLSSFQESGLIDEVDAAGFYDNPDLKAVLDEKTTPRQIIKWQISKCLDQEEPQIFGPDETQDPKEGTRLTGIYFQKARLKGEKKYPRKNLWALLRLHLLFKQRVSMPATPASISASTDPLAGGGTSAPTGAAAGGVPADAGALTDVGTQAAAATTGATGAI